jgi:hypothetical protein
MNGDDATNEEVDLIADILDGEGVSRVRDFVRQRAAQVGGQALTQSLFRQEVERAYAEYEYDVFSDPFLEKKAIEAFERLKRTQPNLQIEGSLGRACREVVGRYGTANARATREMGRTRSLGTRGMPNPNRLTDDDGEAGYNSRQREQEVEEEVASDRMDAIAKIRISRMGRVVEADPDYGRREVRRQREARVTERQQADRDLSEQ